VTQNKSIPSLIQIEYFGLTFIAWNYVYAGSQTGHHPASR